MENLRIMAENLGQKKEIISNFVKIGYIECECCDRDDNDLMGIHVYSSGHIQDVLECDFLDNDHREITLPQLRDMVVLKRNDVRDATHTDQDDWKWYIGSDSYVWQAGNSQQLKQWDQSSLAMVNLKPIKKEWQRESLNDKIASAEVARQKHSHYKKDVSHLKTIDVYRVIDLFQVESNAVGHAIKKLLCSGQRGAKDHKQDIQEAIDSLNRHLEMLAEDEAS